MESGETIVLPRGATDAAHVFKRCYRRLEHAQQFLVDRSFACKAASRSAIAFSVNARPRSDNASTESSLSSFIANSNASSAN